MHRADIAVWGINLFLIGSIAYALADLSWRIIAVQNLGELHIPGAVVNPGMSDASKRSIHLDGISLAVNIFGNAAMDSPQPKAVEAADAPETRLNLTLRGIFAITGSKEAVAIIAQGNNDEAVYQVGDGVPGGAVIEAIYPDRVILRRAGRLETLRMPLEDDLGSSTQPSKPVSGQVTSGSQARRLPPSVVASFKEYRSKAISNPQAVMGLARVEPAMEGEQLKGYRVNPGNEARLFYSVGLRPGDVVTRINGIDVVDTSRVGDIYKVLTEASELEVVVERNGAPTTLAVDLK